MKIVQIPTVNHQFFGAEVKGQYIPRYTRLWYSICFYVVNNSIEPHYLVLYTRHLLIIDLVVL